MSSIPGPLHRDSHFLRNKLGRSYDNNDNNYCNILPHGHKKEYQATLCIQVHIESIVICTNGKHEKYDLECKQAASGGAAAKCRNKKQKEKYWPCCPC